MQGKKAGRQEGREEGREEGRKEGRKEERVENEVRIVCSHVREMRLVGGTGLQVGE